MRKGAFGLALAMGLAVIGCGGGGSSSSGTGTTATTGSSATGTTATGTTSGARVALQPKPGQIELAFLTGQGRSSRAPGDVSLQIGRITYTDQFAEDADPGSLALPQLGLNGYSNNIVRTNVEILRKTNPATGQPLDSRLFQSLSVAFGNIRFETPDGVSTFADVSGVPSSFPVRIRTFPGRYTSQAFFLNDGQFRVESTDTTSFALFDPTAFNLDNGLNLSATLPSFLSDYLSFDVSAMPEAARPVLTDGSRAGRIFFSGDTYAMSATGNSGLFNAINLRRFDPDFPQGSLIEGRFAPPGSIGVPLPPGVGGVSTPGTYSLVQPDPSDPFAINRVTSVQGIYRDYGSMITSLPETIMIAFPSSNDDDQQDVLLVKSTVDGGVTKASDLYYGSLDLSARKIRLYPLANLPTASVAGEILADIASTRDRGGNETVSFSAFRFGTYANLNLPGFPASGDILVYRY